MVEESTGIGLDEHFDFIIDSSGDVKSVAQVEELKKDMSVMVWSVLNNNSIGDILTANVVLELESLIRSQLASDERITNVNEVSVRKLTDGQVVSVIISADSIYGSVVYTN